MSGSRPHTSEAQPGDDPIAIDHALAHARSHPLTVDTQNLQNIPSTAGEPQHDAASDSRVHRASPSLLSPSLRLRRRNTLAPPSAGGLGGRPRAATFRTVEDYDELETDHNERPGWQPGSEPGYDPQLPDGGHASMPTLSAPCQITVVDWADHHVEKRHFDNQGFIEYIARPKEKWAKCRWINVNGLSWDVIQAVGFHKGLHKLALEDVMNLRNRTKADWYPNHAFIVMTLQKLVHLVSEDDGSSSSSNTSLSSHKSFRSLRESFMDLWRSKRTEREEAMQRIGRDSEKVMPNIANGLETLPGGSMLNETAMLRSLQRYHASGNEARTEYMERHSSLAPHKMAISAEQVSLFLTSDNTVISFFEGSAGDVERPIVTRLCTPGTILRESVDGSLLVQAIIDAIIDLAIPLAAVYTDVIGDLELDVLTSPSMHQSRTLYICIAEMNKMLSFLNPVDNLVNVLRDHCTLLEQDEAMEELENPESGVIITPKTQTYLGDVLDHCIIVTENLQQLKQSSDNLISLIFNTISAGQNESMKQLTTVTIIFLPLTFITGFFGQNFPPDLFPEVNKGIWYFWACAVPTVVVTIILLMRDMIYEGLLRIIQRKHIGSLRKQKKRKQKEKLNAAMQKRGSI